MRPVFALLMMIALALPAWAEDVSVFAAASLTRQLGKQVRDTKALAERRGAEAAGAIFVVVRHRDGSVQLYAPAVQALADEDGERRFMTEPQKDPEALAKRFEREAPVTKAPLPEEAPQPVGGSSGSSG